SFSRLLHSNSQGLRRFQTVQVLGAFTNVRVAKYDATDLVALVPFVVPPFPAKIPAPKSFPSRAILVFNTRVTLISAEKSKLSAISPSDLSDWRKSVLPYQRPVAWRSIWQIANTVIPYVALWWLMYRCLSISAWLAIPLAVLAGGFLVRIFIIFHDCTHSSFF